MQTPANDDEQDSGSPADDWLHSDGQPDDNNTTENE